jgi:hypothetical protein
MIVADFFYSIDLGLAYNIEGGFSLMKLTPVWIDSVTDFNSCSNDIQ